MKPLTAALLLAAALLTAPPARAGTCTNLAGDTAAFNACIHQTRAHCAGAGGAYLWSHVICTYPDGGRDDCTVTHGLNLAETGATCTYQPPGT